MERKRIRKPSIPNRQTELEDHLTHIKKTTTPGDQFFNKPLVRNIAKTIIISGTAFGVLYVSRYFLGATANLIKSCKELRDAWKS